MISVGLICVLLNRVEWEKVGWGRDRELQRPREGVASTWAMAGVLALRQPGPP